ncbi:MAG TPA: MFS transporter [Candidatus Limnocylindrales bacterium]|jgi:MFS family permease|nr:MFS transporter [Candidatus Limnocylindrales bacterium]
MTDDSLVASLRGLGPDGRALFALRTMRMFGYGFLAVVLVLYLDAAGLDPLAIGAVLTLTLVGDTVLSLWLTTHADRYGRRRVLVVSSLLVVVAGAVFALTDWLPLLVLAGIIGVISPTGNEVGPFLAVEQASLSEVVPARRRTATFAWYNLAGYVATATGALAAGLLGQALIGAGWPALDAYRAVVALYATIGLAMAVMAWRLGAEIEAPSAAAAADDGVVRRLGLGRSRSVVLRLSALFSLDAFAGGFIPQSLMAYWFTLQFGVSPAALGAIFFAANLLAAVSSLSAARIAARIGLIETMVFTHLPSNVLLLLVPLMPTLPLAVAVLLLRFSLSQMDVPTRQSYVMAVVDPDERSAAAGVTGIARTVGAAISPSISTVLIASAGTAAIPFLLAGGLKIVYDLLIYRDFRSVRPVEEVAAG